MNKIIVRFISAVHLLVILINIISIPFLIVLEPFYIWMPLTTFLVSPLLGGTYCCFNHIENVYRAKAGMPLITDRLAALFNIQDNKE